MEQEVLETLPLCQGISEVHSSCFDAGGELFVVGHVVFAVAVLEDFEEAVVSIDFDIVESFRNLHDAYNLEIKKIIYHL